VAKNFLTKLFFREKKFLIYQNLNFSQEHMFQMSRVAKSITSGGSLFPNLIITVVKKCVFHFWFESLSFFSP